MAASRAYARRASSRARRACSLERAACRSRYSSRGESVKSQPLGPSMLPECVADAEFQVGTVHGADFHLEEHAIAVSRTHQDVEAAFHVRSAVEIDPVH